MKELFKFFMGRNAERSSDELGPPVSIRIPKDLLQKIEEQAIEIGGDRYRSKHFINLLDIGAHYVCAKTDVLKSLPKNIFGLHYRLNFVFYKLDLNPSIVAEKWGDDDAVQWIKWLEGVDTPSFKTLEKFAETYFVNAQWLKHGSHKALTPHTPFLVNELPDDCYTSYYALADYLINLKSDLLSIKIIRSDTSGEVIIVLEYDEDNFITVYCPYFILKDEQSLSGIGLYYLMHLALFCKIFDTTADLRPNTFSIDDRFFQRLKLGEDNLKTLNGPDFDGTKIISDYTSKAIYDTVLLDTIDDSCLWQGATHLFRAIQAEQGFKDRAYNIEGILSSNQINDSNIFKKIELFRPQKDE